MNASTQNTQNNKSRQPSNQNIQVYVRTRPLNEREKSIRSSEVVTVVSPREIVARHTVDAKLPKKFTFDRAFGPESRQVDVYNAVVAPLIEEVLEGYNCTVFAYGQTGTGKTHTMVGNELATLSSAWDDNSEIGIIPRALCHLFDELRMMKVQFTMRVSYLELYNEELCDLLSSDDNAAKIRIFDDSTKKGSVIISGLEEVPVHNKDDVYKLLEKGQERRKTAKTLLNAQSSRSHTVFSILVHMRETDMVNNEEMVKIGKLNLVDLAGSENVSKAGNEKPIRVRETVNINQSLLTLGRVITALVERTPHIPYRESKLTRLLQESLGGRTKTAIIATISPGHKDIEETLSTLEYAHRAKNIQNKPELNQKLSQRAVLNQYTEEIDKLKRDLMAVREKNGIYLADETYYEMTSKMDAQSRELNEKVLLLKALKDELLNKEKIFNEISLKLIDETTAHMDTQTNLERTQNNLQKIQQTLEKTKKRYKEKKMLLDEHIKTEKVLSSQAAQILQVADVATDDTEKLHCTLERRKHIDEKIESASDRLLSHVNENFNQMDVHISKSREQNDKFIEMSLVEIRKATAHEEKLHKGIDAKILDIQKNIEANTQQIIEMQRESLTEIRKHDDEFKKEIFTQLDNVLEKTKVFMQELQNDVEFLHKNRQEEKQVLKDLRAQMEDFHKCRQNVTAAYVAQLNADLEQAKKTNAENMQTINSLKKQLSAEKESQKESKAMIDNFKQTMNEFVQGMHNIAEKSQLDAMADHVDHLAENNLKKEMLEEEYTKQGKAYCQSLEEQDKICFKNVLNNIEKVHECVQQQDIKEAQLTKEAELYKRDKETKLKHIISDYEAHDNLQKSSTEKSLLNLEDTLTSNAKDMKETHSNLQSFAQKQCHSINEKHALTGSLLCSLQTEVWQNLQQQYLELRNSCVQNVTDIKQTELKTYQPTGMTPSKREFRYPRSLKSTSPHEKLIKRIRSELNDIETDLSKTIFEDSDGENAEENTQNTLHDTSINLLNSTPIVKDSQPNIDADYVLNSFENVETKVDVEKAKNISRKRINSTIVDSKEYSNGKENKTS